jgi:MvaI/BcnI restriction endonuclease family
VLAESDFPIEEAIDVFAAFGIEAAFIVPTQTGYEKSILDAHKSVRAFFKFHGIHDFDAQGLGADEFGKKVPITYLSEEGLIEKDISLYRPKTKTGDPRMWTNIRGYAEPYNLLAFIASDDGELFLINCSRAGLLNQTKLPGSFLYKIFTGFSKSETAIKLIDDLRKVAALGWVDSTRFGDTAVGHTLETLLGIKANSSKLPDYLGEIELKSGRRPTSGNPKNKSTLFSKVPDWKNSSMKAAEILQEFGSRNPEKDRLELYVTVSDQPNRQGLYMLYSENLELVETRAIHASNGDMPVAQWDVVNLQEDMRSKHKETFWVQAETRKDPAGNEQFRYVRVTRTRRPMVGNIGPLINAGKITLDYTMSEKSSGGVRDHGYLFRIWPKDLSLLFPAIEKFELI